MPPSEQERFQRHNRFLRSLKSDTLLIIDNFNVTSTQDSCLSVVLKYRCRVLFTTRSRLTEYCSLQLKEIKDMSSLFQLTSIFYSDAEEHRPVVEKIIETVHNHTLAIELAAKLLENGILTPNQLLTKLQEEKAVKPLITTISIPCFRYTLYLRNSRILCISLHPLIQEIAVSENRPSVTTCRTLLTSLQKICLMHGVSNLHANLGELYRMQGQIEPAKEHMETGISLLEEYELLYTNDSIPQISNYAALLAEIQEPERAMSSLQKLARIIKEYNSDHCLDYAQVQESLGNICLITANISQAKTHFKKALKIYENIWSDEPELIEAKYQEIQELYPQVGFSIGKKLSDFLAK